MEIINKKKINFCPCCNSKEIKNEFMSWNNFTYKTCHNCHSSYQDPYIDVKYDDDYWENSKDPDGNIRNLTLEKEFKVKNWYGNIANYLNEMNPGKVLDVGIGLGFLLSSLSAQWQKYGIDISSFSQDFINKNYPEIVFNKTSIENSNFPENYFDVVISYHVIEHLEDPNLHLNKIYKILKKNGFLILGTPNNNSIASKIFGKNFRFYSLGHLCIYNDQSLTYLFKKNNFNIIKREYPYFKTDYFNFKNILKLFYPFKISPPFYGSIITLYAKKK